MLPNKPIIFNDDPVNWNNLNTTNCYLYALKLDMPYYDLNERAFIPGGISKKYVPRCKEHNYQDEEFLNNIYRDLNFLGINYQNIDPNEEASWKIALFLERYKDQLLDFHFLRFQDGIWYHKKGFRGLISKVDYSGNIITNPLDCNMLNNQYVATLKLNKKY
jgi:hypothetical protein